MVRVDDLEPRSSHPPSGRAGPHFEFRVITLPRTTTRNEARQLLTEHAEYGRWELARVRLYLGGTRKVWLRRRILRIDRTASPP